MTGSAGQDGSSIEVCFVDPRTVLQQENLQGLLGDAKQHTRMTVPAALLPQLSKGVMELGDADDPLNAWYFGAKDELFAYRLMGQHATMSGFAAIIELEQLQAIASGSAAATAGLPAWPDFKADLQEGRLHFPSVRSPFLFAGTVLDAPAAAVYQLKKEGQVVGVAISSEATEL
uniref:Uncharacterized protein n=1 Tax=Tetradesmus obliquus TaxID=3088 RepID=A0A383WIB6_TETOB|eukprot:jgi/Sobl393_1/9875/SZX77161.1